MSSCAHGGRDVPMKPTYAVTLKLADGTLLTHSFAVNGRNVERVYANGVLHVPDQWGRLEEAAR